MELAALLFPNIITRYVIGELIKVFAMALFGFVGMMILVGVAQEAMRKGLDPVSIIRLIPYILPEALMFAMPATILFSACFVFGRMAADNEIIAIKSIGIPARVTITPVLLVTLVLSFVGVWLNEVAFTWSYFGIERVVLDSVEPVAYNVLRTQGSFTSDSLAISVERVDGKKLIQPRITVYRPNGQIVNAVAREGMIRGDSSDHSLIFSLTDGSIQIDHQQRLSFPDTITQKVPLLNPHEVERMVRNPSHLSMAQIPNAIEGQQQEIAQMRRVNAVRAASQLAVGNFLALNNQQWDHQTKRLAAADKRLHRLKFVPWRRWANGFSCFCFVIIGIPIALRMKSSDYATTFAVCFLPVLLFYYPLFMFGMDGAKTGRLPPYAVWLSNIVCIIIGIIALRREYQSK